LAQKETAKSALLSGGMFVGALNDSANRIDRLRDNIGLMSDMANVSTEEKKAMYQKAAEGHVQEIVEMRKAQDSLLLTFRSVIDSLALEVSTDDRNIAYEILRRELISGSRTEILQLVDRFWEDLNDYQKQPDMAPSVLLNLAVSR
jgi:hypothetical protein